MMLGMGTLAVVSICILVIAALAAFSIWARDARVDQDSPDDAGITTRERMDAIK